jgi:hypothetical protein
VLNEQGTYLSMHDEEEITRADISFRNSDQHHYEETNDS